MNVERKEKGNGEIGRAREQAGNGRVRTTQTDGQTQERKGGPQES